MIKRFVNWLISKLPKREVTNEIREKIKIKYPGYHLARNGSGRRKKRTEFVDIVERFEKYDREGVIT